MENTVNYNLKKPGQDDFYNVADFNSNADIIDGALKTHDTQLAQKVNKSGDSLTGTLKFGLDYAIGKENNNGRLLMTSGALVSQSSGAYIVMEGADYTSLGGGGNITIVARPEKKITLTGQLVLNEGTSRIVDIRCSIGSPEGLIVAPVGSIFLRTNGGANTTLYVKESGTGNTGWVAK